MRRARAAFGPACALVCAVAAGTVLHAAAASPSDLARERALASRVSRDRALAAVRELVALGARMGGTASGDRAAEALAAALRSAGLPVEIVEDPPRRVHEETAWTVQLGDKPLASAWPYGFSPALARGSYRLVRDEDLPGPGSAAGGERPATPPRALITRAHARAIVPRAVEQGLAAVLTYYPADPNQWQEWAPLGDLRKDGPAVPVFALSFRDGEALRAARAAHPDAAVTLSLETTIHDGRPRTVVATLAGAGARRDEIILVCAHGDSDSGGPGADDNASGEAALLEVARALSAASTAGELPASRPTVRFVVWGSELHSSRAYVASHAAELARHVAVFNYDQAGIGSARDAIYYEGNDVPWNAPLLRTIEAVARDHAGQPGFWTAYTSNPVLGGTDMYEFLPPVHRGSLATGEKIPVTTVFSSAWDHPTVVAQTPGWVSEGWPEQGPLFVDYSALYHSSGDRPELTTEKEPFNMERCARLVVLGIARVMEGRMEGAPAAGSPAR